jgi:hypothetical protein
MARGRLGYVVVMGDGGHGVTGGAVGGCQVWGCQYIGSDMGE